MTIWWFYLVAAFILVAGAAFIWIIIALNKSGSRGQSSILEDLDLATGKDIDHIFSNEFREELKNRGLLHFEKIINDAAEFLQQDLRLTSSQLNEYMKSQLSGKVNAELDKYEQSINDARNLAIDSIKRTSTALEDQRKILGEQVQKEIAAEKTRIIQAFERQLTDIVGHYVVAAIGNEINLNDQLEYILSDLEINKNAMIEDIKNA
jgi:hypothetical protein